MTIRIDDPSHVHGGGRRGAVRSTIALAAAAALVASATSADAGPPQKSGAWSTGFDGPTTAWRARRRRRPSPAGVSNASWIAARLWDLSRPARRTAELERRRARSGAGAVDDNPGATKSAGDR